jgi:type IV secretion system protein VirB5
MKFRNSKNNTNTESPYVKAQQEWTTRLGSAQSQLINWQLIGLGSVILSILLLIALITVTLKHKEYVYVAQVSPNENVVNTVSLNKMVTPTQAQQAYFIAQFINQIMTLPLDPVVARNNWLSAYQKVSGPAVAQLTAFAQSINPLANLGTMTSSVEINNFNAVSNNSLQFTWTQITYDDQGQINQKKVYNGLFTVVQGAPPTDVKSILDNPFGLKITYFSLNSEAQS